MYRKMELDQRLTPHTRINSKWFKDLNVKPKTMIIIQESTGNQILDIASRDILSATSP